MLKNKFTLLLVLIVAFCFNYAIAAAPKKPLTPEQQALKEKMKAERMKKSEAADKLIRHITPDEFKSTVLTDTENLWVVFYGSKKCPHTQRFNPKWLQFQNNMDNGLYNLENVKFAKIECNGEQFKFCVSQENQYWPELMFYFKGDKKASYDGEDEIEDIVKYIKAKKDIFMNGKKASNKGLPPKKPTKQPTKQPPPPKQPPSAYKNGASKQPPSNDIPIQRPPKIPNFKPSDSDMNDDVDGDIDVDENDIEEIIEDNYDNGGTGDYINDNTLIDEAPGSHFIVYSIGGCAACVAGLLFAKKRFRGHRYTRIGGGSSRVQMKYKYDKHIV